MASPSILINHIRLWIAKNLSKLSPRSLQDFVLRHPFYLLWQGGGKVDSGVKLTNEVLVIGTMEGHNRQQIEFLAHLKSTPKVGGVAPENLNVQ
jgi:hypothetical protein